MNTPIYSYLLKYKDSGIKRLHMPGHKGKGPLGIESIDITEIKGADSLFEADGIIAESERNAGELFGSYCLYSTEGSSLSIRATVHLLSLYARSIGKRPKILAVRNAHKAFLSAVALVGAEVEWLKSSPSRNGYLSSFGVTESVDEYLKNNSGEDLPQALYVTSPDYLGYECDIAALSALCHKAGMLLLVDNAHGSYLKFLRESRHPIDLGCDICCDSAHKTLPALTGAGYLHISKAAPEIIRSSARSSMRLFASTSPSYLILASLDLTNEYLADNYREKLSDFVDKLNLCKQRLSNSGYNLVGSEPLKITVSTKSYGYSGYEFAEILRGYGIECEFSDPDFVTLMLAPSSDDIDFVESALVGIERREAILMPPPSLPVTVAKMTPREALLSPSEEILTEESLGRILADPSVGCPPAVPILVSGEVITKEAINTFLYYGIKSIRCVI